MTLLNMIADIDEKLRTMQKHKIKKHKHNPKLVVVQFYEDDLPSLTYILSLKQWEKIKNKNYNYEF